MHNDDQIFFVCLVQWHAFTESWSNGFRPWLFTKSEPNRYADTSVSLLRPWKIFSHLRLCFAHSFFCTCLSVVNYFLALCLSRIQCLCPMYHRQWKVLFLFLYWTWFVLMLSSLLVIDSIHVNRDIDYFWQSHQHSAHWLLSLLTHWVKYQCCDFDAWHCISMSKIFVECLRSNSFSFQSLSARCAITRPAAKTVHWILRK